MHLDGFCVDVACAVMGVIDNNVYVLSDGEGRAGSATILVDPSCNAQEILDGLLRGVKPDAIVLTHAHWDHTGAAAELRRLTGAPVYASEIDAPHIESPNPGHTGRVSEPCPVDVRLTDGSVIEVGNMRWQVISTPGHTKGSICLYCAPEDGVHKDAPGVLVSGDTLFAGTTGRTDFFGGSDFDMSQSMRKLSKLPADTLVLPGHEAVTTIGDERRVFSRWGS